MRLGRLASKEELMGNTQKLEEENRVQKKGESSSSAVPNAKRNFTKGERIS